jgi:hypothetical protein
MLQCLKAILRNREFQGIDGICTAPGTLFVNANAGFPIREACGPANFVFRQHFFDRRTNTHIHKNSFCCLNAILKVYTHFYEIKSVFSTKVVQTLQYLYANAIYD